MFLTKPRSTTRDPNSFPAAQLFLLALVRVAEPIALTSIFPYAWKLVEQYHVTSEPNAPFFAGLLISAFSLAEACSGMYWGSLSDRIGRKPVLLLGCAGTIVSLLAVGFAPSFWVALGGRVVGGLLNGNIGVIQTMVGELVTKPEHEPQAYAVMPFVWSIGTIIGPAIGGCFANPAETYPSLFSPNGVFAKFPYLLPNLICAILLVFAILLGFFLLEETHPDKQPWSTPADLDASVAQTPLLPAQGANAHAAANLTAESYGTFDEVNMHRDATWRVRSNGEWVEDNPMQAKVFSRPVVMFVMALGIFTYHSMTYDHLMPIFLQDKRADDISSYAISSNAFAGGLGLSIRDVGIIMSVNGIIELFIQAAIFPLMAAWFGIWKLLLVVTIGHPISYFIVPYLPLLPIKWLYPSIYVAMTIRNFFSIVAYPLLLIMIKESAPSPSVLGKINGLAAATGAACRTMASPIGGLLYGFSIDIGFTPLAWWVSTLIAMVGALQVPFLSREAHQCHARVHAAAGCCLTKNLSKRLKRRHNSKPKDVVHIRVEDTEADSTGYHGSESSSYSDTDFSAYYDSSSTSPHDSDRESQYDAEAGHMTTSTIFDRTVREV
ncbi:MFS multidrug transporter-like protein [Lophiotrema nucula]|uniref:MFS multidrug transporter-like protein n=1 Tax=Lophiotrema nucula TaxID=690887 RepID=A0A6A5Z8G8_9PLEO|nr:MFS multidrug transporter-like protein [Lophiotrema nucula]